MKAGKKEKENRNKGGMKKKERRKRVPLVKRVR